MSKIIAAVVALVGGWKKWLAVGVGALLLAGVIGFQKIQLANRAAEIARLTGDLQVRDAWLERATADIAAAARVNRDTVAAVDRLRGAYDAALAAVVADRDRLVAEAKSVRTVKERIHVEAQKCVGVPPAIGVALDWVQQRRAAGGD